MAPRPVPEVLARSSFAARAVTGARTAVAGALVGCGVAAAGLVQADVPSSPIVTVAEPFDPEVVLPSRVDASLHRTYDALERAIAAIDDRRRPPALRALRAATTGFSRSARAVLRQVRAVPPPEEEGGESTAGPDSALAALNVDQVGITSLAGLFDGVRNPALNRAIVQALVRAQNRRSAVLNVVVGLDPEGPGADYADAMTDTVPAYADEVANLTEALADDRLTPRARTALRAALQRSKAAEARVTAAYGGE
jgi:hypothetical protein